MSFNNAGVGSTVQFNGGTFQTNSSKPIAFVSPAMSEMDFGDGADNDTAYSAPVAVVDSEGAMFRTDKEGALVLHRGEVLMQTTGNAVIKTIHGLITAKRGALVHITSKEGKVYIKACSNDVVVRAHGTELTLTPGQEVLLSAVAPQQSDMHPSDGVGRRKQDVRQLADGTSVVMSDFSMITLIANLPSLRSANNPDGRKIIDRMLKTAAAIDVVTRAHGNYTATPKDMSPRHNDGGFSADASDEAGSLKPVSYRSSQ
jgi:hypothetical protein